MIEPGITVVIPTFNRAGLITRAVESVLAQTASADQIVIVDDGSSDQTAKVCKPFASRVEYVRQSNAGAAAARNRGVQQARQPWVAFLDSDDLWTPAHLERLREAVRATRGAARFYFADMQMPPEAGGGTLWELCGFKPAAPHELVDDATDWMMLKRQPAMLQSSLFNVTAFHALGGFDLRYRVAEDTEIFCRLGIGGAACAVSGVGCVQTADDQAANRLTHLVSERSESYWRHYVLLWREVLQRHPQLASHQRRLARWNLAESHVCLARWLRRAGRSRESLPQLLHAALVDPELAFWLLRKRSSKGFEEAMRRKLMAVR
jgi:glycosyltransferase involved in cell wall biosynthesis